MTVTPYTVPAHLRASYNCPHCGAYAKQNWFNVQGNGIGISWGFVFDEFKISRCEHCEQACMWRAENLLWPQTRGAPPPNEDLPGDVRVDYEEAASIEQVSPRGAAALLRLCLQKLCLHLGEQGKNINADIERLVQKGLPVEVQRALDVVRVIGNNAVHPGEINVKDNPDTVSSLFVLVNMIADRMISQPKKIGQLYGSLPPAIREAIVKRDASSG